MDACFFLINTVIGTVPSQDLGNQKSRNQQPEAKIDENVWEDWFRFWKGFLTGAQGFQGKCQKLTQSNPFPWCPTNKQTWFTHKYAWYFLKVHNHYLLIVQKLVSSTVKYVNINDFTWFSQIKHGYPPDRRCCSERPSFPRVKEMLVPKSRSNWLPFHQPFQVPKGSFRFPVPF